MKFADMHSDTLTELYLGEYDIYDAPLHISLKKAKELIPYLQIGAVWTDKRLTDDEAYERFFDVVNHFQSSVSAKEGTVRICRTKSALDLSIDVKIPAFVLAVEGARLLGGDISRLDRIAKEGVRLITLQWSGSDCVGGAWNTSDGLTDFGKEVLIKMADYRIAADISHASDKTAEEILDLSDRYGITVCASHSNSRRICSHRRNLTDEMFAEIKNRGGVVGISMAPEHLSDSGRADTSDICRHLYHYLESDGCDTVCFGCDFDGISTTPDGICGIGDITRLRDRLSSEGFSDEILEKLFYGNAHRFIRSILD